MPRFKTSKNIIKDPGRDELWEENWNDVSSAYEPPTKEWDYKRELRIADVEIWECVWEGYGGRGVYAAWRPYAEFYMIRTGWRNQSKGMSVETYYGPGSQSLVIKRMVELNFPISMFNIWIDPSKEYLYKDPLDDKIQYSVGDGDQQSIVHSSEEITKAIREAHKS